MSELSHLIGVLNASHIAALRQVIADVCDEERILADDLTTRQAMADALIVAGARGRSLDLAELKQVARSALREALARNAIRSEPGRGQHTTGR